MLDGAAPVVKLRGLVVGSVVRLEQGKGKKPGGRDNRLELLHGLVAEDLRDVNAVILERMKSPVVLISELAGHIISSGGKRLRPMLTLASAKMCGYAGRRHVNLAACIEFIHTATLLHDDVVDDSELRRGSATANAVWGNKPSVLVGDFLFSRAFQLSVDDGSLKVLDILASTSAILAEGEVMQLMTSNDTSTSEAAYLDVITAKTAALFRSACQLGAVVASRPSSEEEALKALGLNLGILYQLVDDALDYAGRSDTLGKNSGDDFREGKITLPVVLAYRRGSEEERSFWRRAMEEGEQREEDFGHALELLEKHGALADSFERARHYGAMARDALGLFPDGEAKRALLGVVDFCVERDK
ncbi:MAG: polyprenyl synthetase family protein [Alphaproteobacteria bacterium]|nr:polyprenyl synthetase family protein [Alphaproteobacteria bacterium]